MERLIKMYKFNYKEEVLNLKTVLSKCNVRSLLTFGHLLDRVTIDIGCISELEIALEKYLSDLEYLEKQKIK